MLAHIELSRAGSRSSVFVQPHCKPSWYTNAICPVHFNLYLHFRVTNWFISLVVAQSKRKKIRNQSNASPKKTTLPFTIGGNSCRGHEKKSWGGGGSTEDLLTMYGYIRMTHCSRYTGIFIPRRIKLLCNITNGIFTFRLALANAYTMGNELRIFNGMHSMSILVSMLFSC